VWSGLGVRVERVSTAPAASLTPAASGITPPLAEPLSRTLEGSLGPPADMDMSGKLPCPSPSLRAAAQLSEQLVASLQGAEAWSLLPELELALDDARAQSSGRLRRVAELARLEERFAAATTDRVAELAECREREASAEEQAAASRARAAALAAALEQARDRADAAEAELAAAREQAEAAHGAAALPAGAAGSSAGGASSSGEPPAGAGAGAAVEAVAGAVRVAAGEPGGGLPAVAPPPAVCTEEPLDALPAREEAPWRSHPDAASPRPALSPRSHNAAGDALVKRRSIAGTFDSVAGPRDGAGHADGSGAPVFGAAPFGVHADGSPRSEAE